MGAALRTGAIGIVTPDAVLLELDVADYGSRLAARLLDTMFQLMILSALAFAISLVSAVGPTLGTTAAVIVVIVGSFGILFVYPALSETLGRGRTLGKRIIGLRVITIEGGPVRFRHCAARAALAIVDVYPLGALATVSMIMDRKCRRLGDLVAGTVVIREMSEAAKPQAVWFPVPPGWEAYVATLPVANLTIDQYEVLRTFLLRAPRLTNGARAALAARLAREFSTLLGRGPDGLVSDELWLAGVAAAWQLAIAR